MALENETISLNDAIVSREQEINLCNQEKENLIRESLINENI